MTHEWHQKAVARSGGRIEVVVPELSDGEEVEVVVRRNGSDANDVAKRPCFGSAKGRVWIREDFDGPLDDFSEYSK